MKVIEIMKLCRKGLELLQNSCISIKDCQFIDLYDEYQQLISSGEKITFIVAMLSEKYGISIRQVYYIIRKLSSDCNIDAVL